VFCASLSNVRLQFRVDGSQKLEFLERNETIEKSVEASAEESGTTRKGKARRCGRVVEKLVKLQARLRAPDGCPWDREQTHMTLRTYLIEEAYEVVEALESGDDAKFAESWAICCFRWCFTRISRKGQGRFDAADVDSGKSTTRCAAASACVRGKAGAGRESGSEELGKNKG